MSRPLDTMLDAFQDELSKIANAGTAVSKAKKLMPSAKTMAAMGAGAVGFEGLRRANEDRRMGRQIRLQQGSGIF